MKRAKEIVAVTIATGFGSGFLPLAPGSWGALVMAVAAYWLLGSQWWIYSFVLVIIFCIGLYASSIASRFFVSRGGMEHDDDRIVIDEWVGMLITLIPIYFFENSVLYIGIGFLLFRIFDTAKFGLAKTFDQMKNKWGIMLDDAFAGLHAAIALGIILVGLELYTQSL